MMDYICENCLHEQNDSGFCENCIAKENLHCIVVPLNDIIKNGNTKPAIIPFADSDTDWELAYANTRLAKADFGVYGDWSNVKEAAFSDDYGWPLNTKTLYTTSSYNSAYKWNKREPPRRAKAWRDHNYWFIGDVHGNIEEYFEIIKDIRIIDPNAITIQVGDIGLGEYELPTLGIHDWFIQGNHDDINACTEHRNFMGKFGFKDGVFFMGGAATKGIGFHGEELAESDLEEAVRLYKHLKPEIVVTHDAPESIRSSFGAWNKPKNSRTCLALEDMWQAHNPNVWAFGHTHVGMTDNIDGTEFICVAPLESHQIRLGWNSGISEYHKASNPMEMTKTQAVGKFFKNLFKR